VKKYLVIGNPTDHSLSPQLHNYWIKKHKINAIYEKKNISEGDIKNIIGQVRNEKIDGLNVTVPFKKAVIPYLDQLSPLAKKAQSVNTIYIENNKVVGHNTDVGGFELALKSIKYEVKNKKVFILGAGGVVPSIIIALKNMEASKIILSNRTKEKVKNLQKINPELEILDWGKIPDFNIAINATSIGLKKDDEIKIDFSNIAPNKLFYDLIYNPGITKFLSTAKKLGNQIENGKMMFIYQAHQSFTIWHKVIPKIDNETINLLE
jgi:shikimate dehydrogenase